ncbi:MAG: crossover junction endodeoxyribonuclease RuvC, partial [Desulfomonilia bacterium]|nr:crossover junction endodeoxyribonuclease RuvC [Desulfomonilia bacterium]
MIICGIDPGTRCMGYGVIDIHAVPGSPAYVAHGTITPRSNDLPSRLREIFIKTTELFQAFLPGEVAVESSFHALNAQSALKLGQSRGVVILAATLLDIPVFEYTPTEIKKATCGFGHAHKDQISLMVNTLLHLPQDLVTSR